MKNKCVCQWAVIDTKKYLISSKHDGIECYITLISLKNLYSIPIN